MRFFVGSNALLGLALAPVSWLATLMCEGNDDNFVFSNLVHNREGKTLKHEMMGVIVPCRVPIRSLGDSCDCTIGYIRERCRCHRASFFVPSPSLAKLHARSGMELNGHSGGRIAPS